MHRIVAVFSILLAATFAYSQHQHHTQSSSGSQQQHDAQTSSAQAQDDAQSSSAAAQNKAQTEYTGDSIAVTGYLRDTECLLKNPKAAEANTAETKACLRACVRGGAPLGILTRQGDLYTLFGEKTPDPALRSKLVPLTGHYVRVTGWKVVRGGSQGLVLKSIALEK
jgi:hypothetical protein